MNGEKQSLDPGEKARKELEAIEDARKNAKPGTTPQLKLDINSSNFQVESLILQAQKESRETGVDPVKILWAKAQGLPTKELSTNEDNMYKWIELAIEELGGLKE